MTSSERMGDQASTGGDDVCDFSPSLPRTSVSSGPFPSGYPFDVDDSVVCSPTPTDRNLNSWSRPARSVYGGVRQFLCRALKEVHFSGVSNDHQFSHERPKRPDKNLQSLSRTTQLTQEELKHFYRAFKQECPNGTAEPKHFRFILNKYFPLGDCSSYATCLFNAFDPQRKGYLTFEEMVLAISSLSRGSLTDKLRWIFHLYDADADGFISRQELKNVIVATNRLGGSSYLNMKQQQHQHQQQLLQQQRYHHHHHHQHPSNAVFEQMMNQQTDKMFQKLDVNRDGLVTMETFLQVCLQDPTILSSIENISSDIE